MTEPPDRKPASALDRPAARLVALGVFLLVAVFLVWLHRADLLPSEAEPVASDDPVVRCLAERAVDIDRMAQDGTITAEQATLFKSRAEALCQAQLGQGSPGQ